jgi:hypothetical protein
LREANVENMTPEEAKELIERLQKDLM